MSICTGLDDKIYLAINHNEENPLLRKSSIIKFTKTITKVLAEVNGRVSQSLRKCRYSAGDILL